ncbi:hypothetical protein PAPYR_4811 [Paratrimastix pyriformis]|uniref:Uncharacterized protein n=1 Tax=Paratrimastix pyriformis TaxID=342808 RepID=A0ABQ8UPL7_9EUKA|nr:hypothetical protein PAPYR_4811 [Paratrimastix pyriformis]
MNWLTFPLFILSCVFCVLGWGICAFSILIAGVFWGVNAWIPITTACLGGILGVATIGSFFGLIGYDVSRRGKMFLFSSYLFAVIALTVGLGGAGTICLISSGRIGALVQANRALLPQIRESFNTVVHLHLTSDGEALTLVISSYHILGGLCLGTGALLTVAVVLSSILLGPPGQPATLRMGGVTLALGASCLCALGLYTCLTNAPALSAIFALCLGALGGVTAPLALWNGVANVTRKKSPLFLHHIAPPQDSRRGLGTYGIAVGLLGLSTMGLAVATLVVTLAVDRSIVTYCTGSWKQCHLTFGTTDFVALRNLVAANVNMVAGLALWVGAFGLYQGCSSLGYIRRIKAEAAAAKAALRSESLFGVDPEAMKPNTPILLDGALTHLTPRQIGLVRACVHR